MVSFEKISYQGWPNCYRIANDVIEMIITGDVGPRIIRLSFLDDDNEFAEFPDHVGKTGGDEWRLYGGHRLWHAPEVQPRTYYPDNEPVSVEQQGDCVRVTQPVEPTTGIQKQIDIYLDANAAKARLVHRLTNTTMWGVEFAPWALSVMAPGGKVIIPMPPRGAHPDALLPANTMTMWPYTDMADPRWMWGSKYIMLRQEPGNTKPQKVGLLVPDGWTAYARNGHLFVKAFDYIAGATYPDMGCVMETFTNEDMLEVETLGPVVNLAPGASVEHVENWSLHQSVPTPANEADIEANVLPVVKSVL